MSANTLDTAILLFSRSAAGESVAKPWVPNANKLNRTLNADLIKHTRQLAQHSGLPVILISEQQQKGNSFGERFSNALEQVFDKGYSKVIAIGNDCPGLLERDLRLAAKSLDWRSMVIGPAKDGGAYLIGLRRDAFDAKSFTEIPWQTQRVFQELIEWCSGDCALLDVKSDLDSSIDLRHALHITGLPVHLRRKIIAILNCTFTQIFPSVEEHPKVVSIDNNVPRGPPLFHFHFILS